MELIHSLQDINQQELSIAGGKGINLGALTHAGFPVPPGFVLLTGAYQHFLSVNNIVEEVERLAQQATPLDLAACERVSQSIRALFAQYPIPEEIAQAISQAYQQLGTVAIRSSATTEDLPTASFAGLHERLPQCEDARRCPHRSAGVLVFALDSTCSELSCSFEYCFSNGQHGRDYSADGAGRCLWSALYRQSGEWDA